jgi:hypothetical protein
VTGRLTGRTAIVTGASRGLGRSIAVALAPERPNPKTLQPQGVVKPNWRGFVGTPSSVFRRHFEIAVFAGYELMQLVAPDMIAAGHGAIVNISSVASRLPGDGPYGDTTGGCAARVWRIESRGGAPHVVRGVRFGAPQYFCQCAVAVTADDHARIVLVHQGIRR